MTEKDFYGKIFSIFIPLSIVIIYILIRTYWVRRKEKKQAYVENSIAKEATLLRKGKISVEELQAGIWNFNASGVLTLTSISFAIIVLGVGYLYDKSLPHYDRLFFDIIILSVSVGAILSAASLQFWHLCLDKGRAIEDYIRLRNIATLFQVISWLSLYISIFLAVSLVNTVFGILIGIIGGIAIIVILEYKFNFS
jgi:hypothetical protein